MRQKKLKEKERLSQARYWLWHEVESKGGIINTLIFSESALQGGILWYKEGCK